MTPPNESATFFKNISGLSHAVKNNILNPNQETNANP
jgi:hypothetical protein